MIKTGRLRFSRYHQTRRERMRQHSMLKALNEAAWLPIEALCTDKPESMPILKAADVLINQSMTRLLDRVSKTQQRRS